MTRPESARTAPAWQRLDWWFRDRSTGEIVLWQPPNAALSTWLGAAAVRRSDVLPRCRAQLWSIAVGARIVWAADEVLHGTTPYRRLLGAALLIKPVRRLFRH